MSADDPALQSVAARLSILEEIAFGEEYTRPASSIVEQINVLERELDHLVNGNETVLKVYRSLDEIEKLTNMSYIDEKTSDEKILLEFLLLEEQPIADMIQSLEELQKLSHVLDSAHIQNISALEERLKQICQNHFHLRKGSDQLIEQVRTFLDQYHQLMSTLSAKFCNLQPTGEAGQ